MKRVPDHWATYRCEILFAEPALIRAANPTQALHCYAHGLGRPTPEGKVQALPKGLVLWVGPQLIGTVYDVEDADALKGYGSVGT